MKYIYAIVVLLVFIFLGGSISYMNRPIGSYGSIIDGQGYTATSTDSNWEATCAASGPRFKVLKNKAGNFGSVIVTNSTAGRISLYDGTTTNHGDYATSSVWGITIYPSTAAGTYTFDVDFSKGLIVDCSASTNVGSSTITSR